MLSEKLSIPLKIISFTNVVACFLKGEVFGGAAKGSNKVLGLTLGTGFRSAIYQNDAVMDATLWYDKYQEGIAEDLLSICLFTKHYFNRMRRKVKDMKAMIKGGNSSLIKQVFALFGENVGLYPVSRTNRFGFETVVIGGNIARSFDLFSEPLQQVFNRHNLPVHVKSATLHENAALLVAASIWKQGKTDSLTTPTKEPVPITPMEVI